MLTRFLFGAFGDTKIRQIRGVLLLFLLPLTSHSIITVPIPTIGIPPGANTGPCPQFIPTPTGPIFFLGGLPAPCDASCSTPAFNTMGSNVSSSYNDLSQKTTDKSQAVKDAVQELTTGWSPTVTNSFTKQINDYLAGLGASSNRVELAFVTQTKAIERAADHITISVINALKEIKIANSIAATNDDFSSISQPISGDIALSISPILIETRTQERQIQQSMSDAFADYIRDESEVYKTGGSGINSAVMLEDLDSLSSFMISDLLTKQVVEKDSFGSYMRILSMLTSVDKFPESEVIENEQAEFDKKIHIQKLTMVFNTLAKGLLTVNPTTGVDWADFYIDPVVNADNKSSSTGVVRSAIDGPLGEEDWWGMITASNKAGIRRNKIYLDGIAMQVNNKRFEIAELRKNLKSIIAMEVVKSNYKAGI